MRQPNIFCLAHFVIITRFIPGLLHQFLFAFFRFQKILFLSAGIFLPAAPAQADDLKPKLLDSSGGQAQHLSPATVREIFFMRLNSWPDGSRIHVFVLPDDNPLHFRFAKEILGVYPFQLRSAWDRMVYSGTGVAPTTVETLGEMRMRVESTPGGIGYIGE